MAEFVLLIIGDDDAYQALDEDTAKAMYAGHYAFMNALEQAGVTVAASSELASEARTVRPDGTVTDGPFAEAKEQVGGFYVIDVPTIEEAAEWAKKIPMLPGDAIEVRPGK